VGQTIAEKLLSAHNVAGTDVHAGNGLDAWLDGLLVINYHTVRAAYRAMGYPEGPPVVFDPERVFVMNEHVQPPRSVAMALGNRASLHDAERLGIRHFIESEPGVCHQMMLDRGLVRPGQLVAGNDSHVTAYGGINAAGFGVGALEAAYILAFGQIFLTVPPSIRVTLRGAPRPVPFAKDIILYLAGRYGEAFAGDCSLEFGGPFVDTLTPAGRITLADHAVELGAKFGFAAPAGGAGYLPDDDARYARTLEIDCDEIDFQVAQPFEFGNVARVSEVAGIPVDQARLGSCANGRFEDIAIAARLLKGRHVADRVRFYISPASRNVLRQVAEAGLLPILIEAGAHVIDPGCSICQTPGIVLNDEVCISSTTRNYRGRFGGSECGAGRVYLASPATVTASAIAGHIADPTEYLCGIG
jgi:3-isopropylmalate/(R)-2-methylmalate dehydratase large subunit